MQQKALFNQAQPTTADSSSTPRAWFCPIRGHMIEAVVCGKIQERSRAKCEKYECPHVDENAACQQWSDYQKADRP